MNAPSLFQINLPLSRKKFAKKMISRLPAILSMFVPIIFFFVMVMVVVTTGKAAVSVGWGGISNFLVGAVLVALAIVALYCLVYGLYVRAYIHAYYYDASEQFLTIQKNVFTPTEIHVPYQKIQDVYVDQDILDRMLGIYDVHIASATVTSGIEAHIDGVDADVAEKLKNFLLGKIQGGLMSPVVPSATMNIVSTVSEKTVEPPPAGAFSSVNYPISDAWIKASRLNNFLGAGFFAVFYAVMASGCLPLVAVGGHFERIGYGVLALFISFVVVFVILYLVFMWWVKAWRATYFFEFQPQFVLVKSGIIKKEEKHVPYRTIQNVLNQQGPIDRLFGLAKVIIENAAMSGSDASMAGGASRIIIPGQPMAKAKELADELNRILGANNASTTGL